MHRLSRQIRFAVEPFGDFAETGANSHCAKPTVNGLGLYFAIWVELKGAVNKDTGFVINVADIDKIVRDKAAGFFDGFIKQKFARQQNISFEQIAELLCRMWRKTEDEFLPMEIDSLAIELTPARKLSIKERDGKMFYFSEKFDFAASHTLWNEKFSDDENFNIFGKCANIAGHGHNYIAEITVKKQTEDLPLKAGDFERVVQKEFIGLVDHKNLNEDVEHFKTVNPTVENIAEFAFKCLAGKFDGLQLDCVTVWENDRTFCCYREN